VHTHVAVFVDGKPRPVRPGSASGRRSAIRTTAAASSASPKNCLTWLSATPTADRRVSVKRSFVLGDFFDVWGQPLGPNQVGPARGRVTALVDGKVWTGDPQEIRSARTPRSSSRSARRLVARQLIDFPGAF
jgi:hypothetical protein